MSRMTDDDIGRLLLELPHHQASSRFTESVMQKLDRAGRKRASRPTRRLALALAAAVLLGLVGAASRVYLRERSRRSAAERVRSLRGEYRELESELEKLRALEPVLELGGTERVDFVFDLRELAKDGQGGGRPEPVSHLPSRRMEKRQ